MSFTNEDLARLKEKARELEWSYNGISSAGVLALLARLEGSEDLLQRAMRRLKLINGDESKCCMNPDSCMNHSLVREYEAWRKEAGK